MGSLVRSFSLPITGLALIAGVLMSTSWAAGFNDLNSTAVVSSDIKTEKVVQLASIQPVEKSIRISLEKQQVQLIENGIVVAEMIISSGKAGYSTPVGKYKIMNHLKVAYSEQYQLYMDNWMGLIAEDGDYRGFGVHSLPYWKVKTANYQGQDGQFIDGRYYENGKLYEDKEHLGVPMSHGCIRLGISESGFVYNWAENGTPVEIVKF